MAHRGLHFGLSVAMAASSLVGCYFPRGCCVSACTSRGMKHSMGQLTFCREGRKSVRALSWVCFVLGAASSTWGRFPAQSTQLETTPCTTASEHASRPCGTVALPVCVGGELKQVCVSWGLPCTTRGAPTHSHPPAVPASQQHGADKESCTHSVGGLVVPLCELGVGVASRALGGHLHAGPAAVVTAPALRGHNGTVSGLAKELPGLRIQSLKLIPFHSPAVSRDTFH